MTIKKTKSLLNDSVIYLTSNILNAAIPFTLIPILTRHLSTSEYGKVAIFQTLLAGLGSLIGISAQGAASIKYYDSHLTQQELRQFIGNCFFVLASTGLLALLTLGLFSQAFTKWLDLETQWLYLSILASCASFVGLMRLSQWQIRKQAKSYGIFQVSQNIINMLLSLLLVIAFSQGADGRLWALCTVPLIYAGIAVYLLNKDELLDFTWRPKYFKEILQFGIPLIPHSFGYFLLSSADRFVINEKLGMAQVGIYMVAAQLSAAMTIVFDAINNAYAPWLFEQLKINDRNEKRKIIRWTYTYWIGALSISVIAFIIGPTIVTLIAGENYKEASEIIGWLALGQALHGMYLTVTNYIIYSKHTGMLSLSTLNSGVINIGLLFLLTSYLGLKGAAIAFAISMGVKFLSTWAIAQRYHPMPWTDFRTKH